MNNICVKLVEKKILVKKDINSHYWLLSRRLFAVYSTLYIILQPHPNI